MKQLEIFDFIKKPKDRLALQPQVWECMKTCGNFTNVRPDGTKDFFPGGAPNRPRCVNCIMKSKLIDNVWHCWCPNFKTRETDP